MREQDRPVADSSSDQGNPINWMRWIPVAILALIFLAAIIISGRIILIPLLFSMATAYLLAPVVKWFENRGWSRNSSVILTITSALILFILILIFILPSIWQQLNISSHQARTLATDHSRVEPLLSKIKQVSPQFYEIVQAQLDRLKNPEEQARIRAIFADWLKSGLFRLAGLTATVFDLLLIPFFVFYLLADYKKMRARVDKLIPPRYRSITTDLISQMNHVLSSYVRGQVLIAFTMGVLYSVGFLIFRVPLGISLGMLSGLLNVVPYLGTLTGLTLSLTFVALDGAGFGRLFGVIAIFLVVQNFEGYYLTPKLLGGRLQLHPLWVLTCLVIGGNLFGLVGIFLAIPVIAVSKVLLNFFETLYQKSNFYRRAGLTLLTDQGQPLDLSHSSDQSSSLIIQPASSSRPPRSVITTSELKSRVRETDPFPED